MKSSLVFVSTLLFLNSVYADCSTSAPPTWPQSYTVKGFLMIPYAEIREPFYAWYDGPSKQSRIDYYGDMVKTYQLSQLTPYGSSIKIAPVTNEEETNVRTCLQVNGTAENKIDPQAILPSLEGFTCEGQDIIDGLQVEKWLQETTIGDKVNKYVMWISYRSDPDGGSPVAVPRKYEMKGFNSLLGSHYDHYYLTYSDFNDEAVPPKIFEIDSNLTCSSFPGPGDKHIYTFNPMKEFIYPETDSHVEFEFGKFKTKHGKSYENQKEHDLRKNIFRQNVRYIHSMNRQSRGFSLGINHLSDKTDLELKALRGKQYTSGYNGGKPFPYKNLGSVKLPESFDWRIYGAVTPVKDQSVCGSCWSFGTVGAIEGAFFLKNGGKLVRLSQQALVDCSWGYGNNGCDGGEDFRAYQWMMKHGGIPTENDYGPYLGQDGYCHADKVPKVAPITGYVNVTSGDENALKLAIFKHGPISVAIDAGHKTFSFYSNGIYYEPSCGNKVDQLDHAVLAVGYGSIAGKDYWLIKNSWSNYWGNDGYVLMSAKDNNCGVMTTPTYVTM
ncbi:digestive cysteine proteinase 1 [Coccinella septempunctata]|uniref:digestive cysteine proteinase 1 n=1 Tax=Coccinella septempunctata TaxID=41139 RepID=UPI001D08B3BC|nr:digestive cysteine proteinase 1 [Coccinella septempunctata]